MTRTKDYSPEQIQVLRQQAVPYYDRFARIYDICSGDWYYRRVRRFAVQRLRLEEDKTVLNLPCGTGLNHRHFQQYLEVDMR